MLTAIVTATILEQALIDLATRRQHSRAVQRLWERILALTAQRLAPENRHFTRDVASRAFERIVRDCANLVQRAVPPESLDLADLIRAAAEISPDEFVAARVHWTLLHFLALERRHWVVAPVDPDTLRSEASDMTELLATLETLSTLSKGDLEFLIDFCQDASAEITAARLGKKPDAVRQRASRLRARLRQAGSQ